MTTHTDTLISVDITRAWWEAFTAESFIDDAMAWARQDPASRERDDLLEQTARLLATQPSSRTKRLIRFRLPVEVVRALHTHADWYAYYWGEQQAADCWGDDADRLRWIALGRSSRSFATKLSALLVEAVWDDPSAA
jgi:hypothetical protein